MQTSSSDTELVRAFIYSNDMLLHLDKTIGIREHYQSSEADIFTRLASDATSDELLKFYKKFVRVDINEKSGVVSIYSQAFTPAYAKKITDTIVERAEWYINSISHQLAEAQLEFVRGEHQLIEDKLNQAQADLLKFQQQHHLLDPTAEGAALQQIAYSLEGEIASKEAELKALTSIMSSTSPQVVRAKNEISALQYQLQLERDKLALDSEGNHSVSQLLAQYTDLKIKMDLALHAYSSSQVSLEKTRTEAYRKIKFLIIVQKPVLPDDIKYPSTYYNITLLTLLLILLYGILIILIKTTFELKA
ncbi:capsular polysaccharide export system inner membrane protein KpsE [Vibrio astriarenae]|nr:capsular polysaccharide export system inner membrane protein KpsE [Vibrio sp. C7]